jgi:hypothetical protein
MAEKGKRTALKDRSKEEIQAEINKLQAAYYAKDLDEALASSGLLASFEKAQLILKGKGVSEVQLLTALGKAAKIARLEIKQGAAKSRSKRTTTNIARPKNQQP